MQQAVDDINNKICPSEMEEAVVYLFTQMTKLQHENQNLKESLEKAMKEKPASIATISDLAQLANAITKLEGDEEDLFTITSYNNILDDFIKEYPLYSKEEFERNLLEVVKRLEKKREN